jgi:hypothetical protein
MPVIYDSCYSCALFLVAKGGDEKRFSPDT